MATPDMRLRLSIRRHGVPEMKLVWPCSHSPEMTIAALLSSVNEVVPLESSGWGLEDYAVEFVDSQGGSFECLHFQKIAQILKDEDQVIIRSLLTDDLKRRRLSGRHQISTDGKHLVDGIAFGRPWLRVPGDRPALELPPRKRARIAANEMQLAEPDVEQLMLEAPPGPSEDETWRARLQEYDRSESDSSYVASSTSHSSRASDDSDGDNAFATNEVEGEHRASGSDPNDGRDGLAELTGRSVHRLAAIRAAYPLISTAIIKKEFRKQKKDVRNTYDALQKKTKPLLAFDEVLERMVLRVSEAPSLKEQDSVGMLGPPQSVQKPLIQEVDSETDSKSSGKSSSISDPTSDESSSSEDESDSDDPASIAEAQSSAELSSSDNESESDASSSETESQHSDETCTDSPESSDDESSGGERRKPAAPAVNNNVHCESAPFQGLTKTQKRNLRRRKRKALNKSSITAPSPDTELLSRKDALLRAISNDPPSTDSRAEPASTDALDQSTTDTQDEALSLTNGSAPRRRSQMDKAASRRMIFGALGLRTPKTKADEDKIKKELMKYVRPIKGPRVGDAVDPPPTAALLEDPNEDTWRSKINYRAVECCHEDMKLSEPPFPFVQRWDSQQRFSSMRKRKRTYDEHNGDESFAVSLADITDSGWQALGEGGGVRTQDAIVNYVVGAGIDQEDLPELPADLKSLPVLQRGVAKEGMVITWKQCVMSKATQWQPTITSITAEVLPGSGESSLEVRVALRDREQRDKVYDEKTGQRVFDKFETPDFEDGEAEEDDGRRTVEWSEMMEPRILREFL